ncbi:MAG: hypothetical protein F4X91_14175 [Nitrospinae bacterium]|nr:hypothetical protein [Nitrospinota bacterium]
MPYKDPVIRRERERERHRRRVEERRAMGLCIKCGKNRPAPGRSLCEACLERSRAAERARYERARLEGAAYGGRDTESRRRMALERSRRRRRERTEAGLCTTCGERKPVEGGAVCETCREERQAAERELYADRKASGRCGRCGAEVIGKASTCARCAARDAKRRPRKNAASRARYHGRRASRVCVDCGEYAGAAARCERCARRSYLSSGEHKGMPVHPPRYTVVEFATGIEHGPLDSWEEVAMCLAFERLSREEVEVVEDTCVTAKLTAAPW